MISPNSTAAYEYIQTPNPAALHPRLLRIEILSMHPFITTPKYYSSALSSQNMLRLLLYYDSSCTRYSNSSTRTRRACDFGRMVRDTYTWYQAPGIRYQVPGINFNSDLWPFTVRWAIVRYRAPCEPEEV